MAYKIAGTDVHKKMLAVVVADVEVEADFHFERHKVGTSPDELRALAGWLVERQVDAVVMESTAQYWRSVWEALELHWRRLRRTHDGASPLSGTLRLAEAQSNRGTGGRKRDFPVDSAQQIIAEVGATAATFPSPKHIASWMGACPGTEESAGKNYSQRCPKGNRQMRRVLNQAANAVKAKRTIFAIVYRRLVARLGHAQADGPSLTGSVV